MVNYNFPMAHSVVLEFAQCAPSSSQSATAHFLRTRGASIHKRTETLARFVSILTTYNNEGNWLLRRQHLIFLLFTFNYSYLLVQLDLVLDTIKSVHLRVVSPRIGERGHQVQGERRTCCQFFRG